MEAASQPLPDDDRPPVCRECGALVPGWEIDQRRLLALRSENGAKDAQLQDQAESIVRTSNQLTQVRRQMKKLQAQQAATDDETVQIAEQAAAYWKQLLAPKTRELKGPRLESTIARAKAGYTLDELKLAIYGYYCRQFIVDGKRKHTGRSDQRWIDLALIMRDANHVDTGIAMAQEDAKLDVELVHRGASLKQAFLCDCGHPRADHVRPDLMFKFLIDRFGEQDGERLWLKGQEPCAQPDCACVTFDNYNRLVDERIERTRHAPTPPPPPPSSRAA